MLKIDLEVLVDDETGIHPEIRGVDLPKLVEQEPEKYIFFLNPERFEKLVQIYMEMGKERALALRSKQIMKIRPEWRKDEALCSLAAILSMVNWKSSDKLGEAQGYCMGTLTEIALKRPVYAVFLARRDEMLTRSGVVLKKILDYWIHIPTNN